MITIDRFTKNIGRCIVGGLVLMGAAPSTASAQALHDHAAASPRQSVTAQEKAETGALLDAVRAATERFRNSRIAEAEGYALQFGCVSGSDAGAMGLHFINPALVADGQLDVARPEIILYEALPNGTLSMTGADYIVLADAWNATHAGPPQLMGQLFHLFDAPNRFGLPPFYTLHVWAWKENPNGAFTNWNPNVSCAAFSDQSR